MSDSPIDVKPGTEDKTLTQDKHRLRFRRVAAGLSLTDAAGAAGYSKAHLSMLESGEHGASPECLGKLAHVYGCEIRDLMPAEPDGAVA